MDSTPASTIILPPGEALKPERDGTLILPPGAAVRTENGEPVTYPDGGLLNTGTGQATVTYRRVTFNSLDGSAATLAEVTHGNKLKKPADPVRAGYTFGGWYKEESCITPWDFGTDIVTEDTTLYARWISDAPPSPTEYTIAFDSRGGSAVGSITVSYGGRAIKPADPVRAGYTFGGWYKEESCITPWDFDTDIVTEDTTLYARWTKNSASGSEDGRTGSKEESRKEESSGEYAFWQKVQKKIEAAEPGETVRIDARSYERMYRTVMEALRKSRQVTLVIRWKGKEEIVLSSEEALSEPMRIHYPLSYLAEYGFSAARTENASEKKNPATGAACA